MPHTNPAIDEKLKQAFIQLLEGDIEFLPSKISLLVSSGINLWIELFPYAENSTAGYYPLLYIACKQATSKVIEYLIKACPIDCLNIFINGNDEAVPLSVAKSKKIIDLLLAKEANPNANHQGESLLHLAIAKENDNYKLRKLLEYGAEVNSYNTEGFTPLHIACKNGYSSYVSVLLEYGADLKIQTKAKGAQKSENVLSLILAKAYTHVPLSVANKLAKIIEQLFINNYKEISQFYLYALKSESEQIQNLMLACRKLQVIESIQIPASLVLLQGASWEGSQEALSKTSKKVSLIVDELKKIVICHECQDKTSDVKRSGNYKALLQKIDNINFYTSSLASDDTHKYFKIINKKIFQQIVINLWFEDCLINDKLKRACQLFFLIDNPNINQRKILALKIAKSNFDILLFSKNLNYQKYFASYLLNNISDKLLSDTSAHQFSLLKTYKEDYPNIVKNEEFIKAIEQEIKGPEIINFIKLTKKKDYQEEDCLHYIQCMIQKNENEASQYLPSNMSPLQYLTKFAKHHSYTKQYIDKLPIATLYEQRKFNGAYYNIIACERWWTKYTLMGRYYCDPSETRYAPITYSSYVESRLTIFSLHYYFYDYAIKSMPEFNSRIVEFMNLFRLILSKKLKHQLIKDVEAIITRLSDKLFHFDPRFQIWCEYLLKLIKAKSRLYLERLVNEYIDYISNPPQTVLQDEKERETVEIIRKKMIEANIIKDRVDPQQANLTLQINDNQNFQERALKEKLKLEFSYLLIHSTSGFIISALNKLNEKGVDVWKEDFLILQEKDLKINELNCLEVTQNKSLIELLYFYQVKFKISENMDACLQSCPAEIKTTLIQQAGPLLLDACTRLDTETVELFLRHGVNINFAREEEYSYTPLWIATSFPYSTEVFKLVKLLLDYGADPKQNLNNSQPSCIENAFKNFNAMVIELLVKKRPQVNYFSDNTNILAEMLSNVENSAVERFQIIKCIQVLFNYFSDKIIAYHEGLFTKGHTPSYFVFSGKNVPRVHSEIVLEEIIYHLPSKLIALFIEKTKPKNPSFKETDYQWDWAKIKIFSEQKDIVLNELKKENIGNDSFKKLLKQIRYYSINNNIFADRLKLKVIQAWICYYINNNELNNARNLLIPFKYKLPHECLLVAKFLNTRQQGNDLQIAKDLLQGLDDIFFLEEGKSQFDNVFQVPVTNGTRREISNFYQPLIQAAKIKEYKELAMRDSDPKSFIRLYFHYTYNKNNPQKAAPFLHKSCFFSNDVFCCIAQYGDSEDLVTYCENIAAKQLQIKLNEKYTVERGTFFDKTITAQEITKQFNKSLYIDFKAVIDKRLCIFNIHQYFCEYGWQKLEGFSSRLVQFSELLTALYHTKRINFHIDIKNTLKNINDTSSMMIGIIDKSFLERCENLIGYDYEYITKRINEYLSYIVEFQDNASKEANVINIVREKLQKILPKSEDKFKQQLI